MPGKTKLFLLFSACLLTMCKNYAGDSITYRNGLSCQNYVDHRFFEWSGEKYNVYVREEGADCTYMCPDGTVRETNISGSISSMYAASQGELDGQFCGIVASATPTQSLATLTATLSPSPTSSPTRASSATATAPAISAPLLSGGVSMCDLGGKLINFRILDSVPDLTGSTLVVQIAEQESTCYVNPSNPDLLTCRIPNDISFPANIVVTLDGALVNNFEYSGVGCAVLTTPTPLKIRSYP